MYRSNKAQDNGTQTSTLHVSGLHNASSLLFHLEPLAQWMCVPSITEICVNRPGEVFCEQAGKWTHYVVPSLTFEHLKALAIATAQFSGHDLSESNPLLSATLPEGERIQIVLPPACEANTVSMTIRKPSLAQHTLADYDRQGFFNGIRPVVQEFSEQEHRLMALKAEYKYAHFLKMAVTLQKVIVVSGETGSGKTTFMKALIEEIPQNERLITIEDVPELRLPNHHNHVHLFYPSEAKEEENAFLTPAALLKSCLRMKPTRILLAELRGGEAFDFMQVAASGHGGSITSCHAGSVELTFERLALMILQNRQGRALSYAVIRQLLYQVVDVVIHIHNDMQLKKGRHITELWYDPLKKRSIGDSDKIKMHSN